MRKKSKRSQATEFGQNVRMDIIRRDRGECIFCRMGYDSQKADPFELKVKDIMHFIPRSKGGLGVEQNGAVGCRYHHGLLDNGNRGSRQEMLEIFEGYLKSRYEDWNRKELVYDKYR